MSSRGRHHSSRQSVMDVSNAKSIITEQLETIAQPFGQDIATPIFSDFPQMPSGKSDKTIPKYEETLYKYLNKEWMKTGKTSIIINNAATVASTSPDLSFKQLIELLPSLNMDEKTPPPPPPKNTVSVLAYVQNVKYDNPYHRAAFQFLVDTILAEFLHKLLLASDESDDTQSFEELFKLIINLFYQDKPQSPFYTRLRLINGETWAHSIYIISNHVPAQVFEQMLSKMPSQKDSDIDTQLFLTLFQWISISDKAKLNYVKLPDQFKTLEIIAKKAKTSGPIHAPAMSFFKNLMGYLLNVHEPYRKHQFIYDLSEIAKEYTTEKGYIGPAFSMRALLYRFNDHKKMKLSLEEYMDKYIKMTESLAPYHIETFLYFVRGKNYGAKCALDVSHENLKWRCPEGKKMIDYVFKLIIKNGDKYTKAQDILADLLIQIACNDFQDFVNRLLLDLIKPGFADKNLQALFVAAHTILASNTHFKEYAEKGNDESTMNKFKDIFLQEINKLLTNLLSGKASGSAKVYGSVPFVESMHLINEIGHSEEIIASKLELAIDQLIETSGACQPLLFPKKILTPTTKNNWTKILHPFFKEQLFESYSTFKLSYCAEEFYQRSYAVAGISLIPYLPYDESLLKQLIKLVFCPLQHIASMSIRVLQAISCKEPKLFNKIIMFLCADIPPTIEHLYVLLDSLRCILNASLFVHASIQEETRNSIFTYIILGLCSPSHQLRLLALKLADYVASIAFGKEPNLNRFLNEFGSNIDQVTLSNVFTLCCIKDQPDLSNVQPLEFTSIAGTDCDSLYMFALIGLGEALRSSALQPFIEKCYPQLINSVEGLSRTNPVFFANVVVFCGSLSANSMIEFVSQQMPQVIEQLNTLGKNKIMPIAALYTSVISNKRIQILNDMVCNSTFDFHLLAYNLRQMTNNSISDFAEICLPKCREIIQFAKEHKFFPDEVKYGVNEDKLLKDDHMIFAICDTMITIRAIYNNMFETYGVTPNGPYTRLPLFKHEKETDPEKDSVLFHFVINYSFVNDKKLSELKEQSIYALDAYAHYYTVPNTIYQSLLQNSEKIAAISFRFLASILTAYYFEILPQFIATSTKDIGNPNDQTPILFLKAIAEQFYKPDNSNKYLTEWSANACKEMSEIESQFASRTLYCSGSLLAISLFSLCNLNAEVRQAGFRILWNIAIPTILAKKPDANIAKLADKLIKLQPLVVSQHPELSEGLLIGISRQMALYLDFIQEQFLYKASELLVQYPNNTVFQNICVPFFDNIEFNRAENGIISSTLPELIYYSGYSFITNFIENIVTLPLNRAHIQILDQLVQQPSVNKDVSTLEFIILMIYQLQQKSEDNASKCVEILTYLLTQKPKEILGYISTYMRFSSWFYHQMQLSRVDLSFDMDKFMDTIMNKEGSDKEKEEEEETDSIVLYDVVVKFSIRVLQAFIAENSNTVNKVVHIVLLFCVGNYNEFDKAPQKLLSTIIGEEKSDIPLLLHSFSSSLVSTHDHLSNISPKDLTSDISQLAEYAKAPVSVIAKTVKFIYSLPEKILSLLRNEALQWALCCGELQIALPCLKIAHMTMKTADNNTINILLRTVHIITSILTERSDPQFQNESCWLSVIIEKQNPDYPLAIQYVSLLLKLIDKALTLSNEPDEDIYSFAVNCLNCHYEEHIQIVIESLAIIKNCLSNKKFLKKVLKEVNPRGTGFLELFFSMSNTTASLEAVFDFIIFCILKDCTVLLTSGKIESILITILPYLFARRHDEITSEVINKIVESIKDEGFKKQILKPMAGSPEDYLNPFLSPLIKEINEPTFFEDLIRFYTNTLKADSQYTAPVFVICTALVKSKKVNVAVEYYAELGYKAVKDTDPERNKVVLTFLSMLNIKGGTTKLILNSKKAKKFPEIKLLHKMDLSQWKIEEGVDPFSSIKTLPPITLIDLDYLGTKFQKPITAAVQCIKVQPFTSWSDIMYKTGLFKDITAPPDRIAQIEPIQNAQQLFDLFGKVIRGEIKDLDDEDAAFKKREIKDIDDAAEVGSAPASTSNINNVNNASIPIEQYCVIAAKEFMADATEIEEIGADMFTSIKLPSFFPTLR